jgi:hypothetical protein
MMGGLLLEFDVRSGKASSNESGEQGFTSSDIAGFRSPHRAVPEDSAFRCRLETLLPDQQAVLLVTFWHGRDHSQSGDYPPFFKHARRSLNHLASYLLSSPAPPPRVETGIAVLRG